MSFAGGNPCCAGGVCVPCVRYPQPMPPLVPLDQTPNTPTCVSCNPGNASDPNGGSTGQMCLCLDAESVVPLYGGESKRAKDLQVGDKVISGEGCPEVIFSKTESDQPRLKVSFTGGYVVVSETHHLLNPTGCEVIASTVQPGDELLAEDGEATVVVNSVETLPVGPVVGISCHPLHVYRCGGLLHHNKNQGENPNAGL